MADNDRLGLSFLLSALRAEAAIRGAAISMLTSEMAASRKLFRSFLLVKTFPSIMR